MQRFDSDTSLVTDNLYLINAALKNEGKFLIAVPDVSSVKKKRRYTHDEQVDLDVKTSNNLIGDIINLSQELNTRIWDVLNRGGSYNDIEEIYKDVCILNIMSGIEIDKAKKEFNINNAKELRRLRDKYKIEGDDGRAIKPNFFKAKDIGKGYYDRKRKNYKKHLTTMDHVQTCINSYRAQREEIGKKQEYLPFSALLGNGIDVHRRQYEKVTRVINAVTDMTNDVMFVHPKAFSSSPMKTAEKAVLWFRNEGYDFNCLVMAHTHRLGSYKIGNTTMYEQGAACETQKMRYGDGALVNSQQQGCIYVCLDKDGYNIESATKLVAF